MFPDWQMVYLAKVSVWRRPVNHVNAEPELAQNHRFRKAAFSRLRSRQGELLCQCNVGLSPARARTSACWACHPGKNNHSRVQRDDPLTLRSAPPSKHFLTGLKEVSRERLEAGLA